MEPTQEQIENYWLSSLASKKEDMLERCLVIRFNNGQTLPVVYPTVEYAENVLQKYIDWVKSNDDGYMINDTGIVRQKDIQYIVKATSLPETLLEFLNVIPKPQSSQLL